MPDLQAIKYITSSLKTSHNFHVVETLTTFECFVFLGFSEICEKKIDIDIVFTHDDNSSLLGVGHRGGEGAEQVSVTSLLTERVKSTGEKHTPGYLFCSFSGEGWVRFVLAAPRGLNRQLKGHLYSQSHH